eukprot:3476468-Rhodomonas_salina.3
MALERERGVLQGERERALMGEVEERKRETGRLREELERKTEEVERLRREMEGEREEAEKTRGKERAAREREQQAAVAQAAALKKAELAMKQVPTSCLPTLFFFASWVEVESSLLDIESKTIFSRRSQRC